MRYDYRCNKCEVVFEVEKSMSAPGPKSCPKCRGRKVERYFGNEAPAMIYANRPPWTYKEALKFKTCSHNGGPTFKIDPAKHGDVGAWHSPGELAPKKAKKN